MKSIISLYCICFIISILVLRSGFSQTIGTFSSVSPGVQLQNFVLPSTHTFQRIIKSGDALSAGGSLGGNLDFTGYVPISGSSTNGYLSISSETPVAQVGILNILYNAGTRLWNTTGSGNVLFSIGSASSDLGNVSRFCSGTITSDNTIIVCEETTTGGNINTGVDSYEDLGWVLEIDPATRTVKDYNADERADKLWAIGRQAHENVAIKSDKTIIYWGADNGGLGYIYKFVPVTAGNYTSGLLYVLLTTSSLSTGTWQLIPNTTFTERNNTVSASTGAGAYSFDGIEDVEIGPDGKVYFAAKGPGRVYRFTDIGSTVSNLEVFVENTTYDVDPGPAIVNEAWGLGNDNLAFDGEGNLWVLQDGSRNHIWVVGSTHSSANPAVRLFAKTPSGSEPTGITFSPDYKFMFISFQHPSASNTSVQTDAAGISVVFNTSTTVVLARKENLGLSVVSVVLTNFKAIETKSGVKLNWETSSEQDNAYFLVEYSSNGNVFNSIAKITGAGTTNTIRKYEYLHQFPAEKNYYRLAQTDFDGRVKNSPVIQLGLILSKKHLSVFFNSLKNNIQILNYSIEAGSMYLISDAKGNVLKKGNLLSGEIQLGFIPHGIYYLRIINKAGIATISNSFLK